MISPKWRKFTLKNGGIVHVGYLPHNNGMLSWAAQYERPPAMGRWSNTLHTGISAGGSSLRKVMGELRLKIAADWNPDIEKVTKKLGKSRTNLYLEGTKEKVIRNIGSSPVYIFKNPDSPLKDGIVLRPGETLDIRSGVSLLSWGLKNKSHIDVLEIG